MDRATQRRICSQPFTSQGGHIGSGAALSSDSRANAEELVAGT